jgi:hypothetical protein
LTARLLEIERMKKDRTLLARIKRAVERARHDGPIMVLQLMIREGLSWIGILFYPFYYIKEIMPQNLAAQVATIPPDFHFSVFGLEELATISKHPERKGYVEENYVYDNYKAGDICLGCTYNGEMAGFTWYSLKENRHWFYQSTMQDNEAYLYDIFVFKAFRGKNLSLILRLKNYEVLANMGRDTFYSITDCSNTPSFRFKRKLNAQIVFLGLHLEFWDKWRRTYIVKKYNA